MGSGDTQLEVSFILQHNDILHASIISVRASDDGSDIPQRERTPACLQTCSAENRSKNEYKGITG